MPWVESERGPPRWLALLQYYTGRVQMDVDELIMWHPRGILWHQRTEGGILWPLQWCWVWSACVHIMKWLQVGCHTCYQYVTETDETLETSHLADWRGMENPWQPWRVQGADKIYWRGWLLHSNTSGAPRFDDRLVWGQLWRTPWHLPVKPWNPEDGERSSDDYERRNYWAAAFVDVSIRCDS